MDNRRGYYIFVKHFTKNGKTYYAEEYGKKAFKLWIPYKKGA